MNNFKANDDLINHVGSQHIFCRVKSVRDDGLLVVHNQRLGTWLADPDKCDHYEVFQIEKWDAYNKELKQKKGA